MAKMGYFERLAKGLPEPKEKKAVDVFANLGKPKRKRKPVDVFARVARRMKEEEAAKKQ